MSLKSATVSIFSALTSDYELLDMMQIPSYDMETIKDYIVEDRYPVIVADDNMSRVCVYELPTTPSGNGETGWVEVDIHVPKEINRKDRRILLIADKIIKILDEKQRKVRGLKPVESVVNLRYYNRLPNMATDTNTWVRYGLVFKYDYIRL